MTTRAAARPLTKTAIAVPPDLLAQVDRTAREWGLSRSRFITAVLRRVAGARRDAELKRRVDALFAESGVRDEQLRMAQQLESAGIPADERW